MLTLAHDLKTPLIGTNRMLDAMIIGIVESEDFVNICYRLKESNNTMLRMIWNSLELYRSESGELRPLFQPVDLSELAQSCREEFTFLAQEKKLELVSKVAPHTTVKTDRLMMRRIMV